MKRVILHVGLGKTGTSTIQSTLADNRAALAALGVSYPGGEVAHHDLLARIHQQGARHFWFLNRAMGPDAAVAAADTQMDALTQAAQAGTPVIVLSSEYFQNLKAPQFADLDAQVSALGYQLETLCFMREPVALTASRVGQAVKMGTFRIDDLLERSYQALALTHLRSALSALGRDRVHLRKMEEAQATGLTRALLQVAGVAAPASLQDQRQNTGLTRAAIYFLDAVNAIDNAQRKLAQKMMPQAEAMAGPRFDLPPDIARRIAAEARPEQEWLQRRMGLSYDLPAIADGPDYPSQMESAARKLQALSRTRPAATNWLRRSSARSV